MDVDIATFKALGEALAIGLLVGIERYHSRAQGERQSAGVRTFALISLLGALCALVGEPHVTTVILGTFSALLSIGYWRESERSVGLTTEIAAIITFVLGYLMASHETVAIASAIVVTLLLAHKATLHRFVRGGITEVEVYDTLKFLVVVFVVYPLLPARVVTPLAEVDPRQLWLLVIVMSTIAYAGYVLTRALGARWGLVVSSIVGGLVSTTAVTTALADRSRAVPAHARVFGVVAVLGNSVQPLRILLMILLVSPLLAKRMAVPLVAMLLVGLIGAVVVARVRRVWDAELAVDMLLRNPYSFWPAFEFAVLVTAVLLVSRTIRTAFGEEAVMVVAGVAGLVDVSAISVALAGMVQEGVLDPTAGAWAVLLALAVNDAVKLALSIARGTAVFAVWVAGGFVAMLAVGIAAFVLVPAG